MSDIQHQIIEGLIDGFTRAIARDRENLARVSAELIETQRRHCRVLAEAIGLAQRLLRDAANTIGSTATERAVDEIERLKRFRDGNYTQADLEGKPC